MLFILPYRQKNKNSTFLENIRAPPTSNFVTIRNQKKSEEIMKKFSKNKNIFFNGTLDVLLLDYSDLSDEYLLREGKKLVYAY